MYVPQAVPSPGPTFGPKRRKPGPTFRDAPASRSPREPGQAPRGNPRPDRSGHRPLGWGQPRSDPGAGAAVFNGPFGWVATVRPSGRFSQPAPGTAARPRPGRDHQGGGLGALWSLRAG